MMYFPEDIKATIIVSDQAGTNLEIRSEDILAAQETSVINGYYMAYEFMTNEDYIPAPTEIDMTVQPGEFNVFRAYVR